VRRLATFILLLRGFFTMQNVFANPRPTCATPDRLVLGPLRNAQLSE
jgi:hypothetical protein